MLITIFLITINNKIKIKILINILTSFEINYKNHTSFSCLCQQKLHDKIRQIITEAIIPAISAARAAYKTNLVFFISRALV